MFKFREGISGLEFPKYNSDGTFRVIDRSPKWNKLRSSTDLKEMYIVTARTLSVFEYIDRDDVYLTPNMTY